ncbi:alpha/beta hydrolase [Streptococcus sp. AM43-2AT]|mgnify:FL=1|uniref:alpha/beta fold hydrolase n=1 Tax=Streptococcus sp. AM43-2AT TaxID=2293247 RepID=UPI000EC1C842|nr:alpha/beta hydrolase [Streptococcus sp. AM43-2AT]RJU24104.1 alpha/beta fold hydrolase [Streptococcus sp. AM43-2AT]
MKLIFLHGLGQDAHSWQGVQDALSPMHSESFAIFSSPSESYQEAKDRLTEYLQQENEPYILVGLSLGGVLALELSSQDLPQLKGLVLSGTQYKLNTNLLYRLQILLFRLIPKPVFEKQGANKQHMLQILTELKSLNLTDTAKTCQLPSLVICGSKDRANQASSKKLANLLPKGHYQEIADGGHLLNSQKPNELAQAIKQFVGEFKNEEASLKNSSS